MSNPKFKVENYSNLGGINSKFSQHLTSPLEFLDIKNFDFQTPGALTQRWGSTQYMAQTLVGKITALSEYQKLNGSSMVIVGSTGGMWFGATTGQFQGMSLTNLNATFLLDTTYGFAKVGTVQSGFTTWIVRAELRINDIIYYKGITSSAYYGYGTYDQINGLGTGSTFVEAPKAHSGNYSSIEYLVDNSFIADGNKFVKFNGSTATPIGMPNPSINIITAGFTTGISNVIGFHGPGAAIFYFSYINNRGFESNIIPLVSCMGTANSSSLMPVNYSGATNALDGVSGIFGMTLTLNTPIQYGISSINVYAYVDQTPSAYSFTSGFPTAVGHNSYVSYPAMDGLIYTLMNNIPASGSTVTTFSLGTTFNIGGSYSFLWNNAGQLPNPTTNQYQNIGLTFTNKYRVYKQLNGATTGFHDWFASLEYTNFYPQYLATFDNRLFCAGFSSAPSTVWFSDVKEPEGYLPENSFEVRTNDSDYITAMKSYQTRLYIFKRNSFHVLVGDGPDNFFVQEISPIYGCLNNRCVVLFENVMFFLDRKGVIEYTGSNISFISTKIQPIFDRMNYNSALTEACAAHDKLRNQVLFSIPVDGSTTNNITLVYDYIAQAWTTHKGYNPSIYAEIQGYNNVRRLFCGDYSGRVNWFSASFLSDNGTGFTLSYKTRYLHDMGDSVQKQFRRLYLNSDDIGSTLANVINFYQDYGASIVSGRTLVLGAFQERIDFGISAKSLAYELLVVNTTNSPLKINGFTIESRMQRMV